MHESIRVESPAKSLTVGPTSCVGELDTWNMSTMYKIKLWQPANLSFTGAAVDPSTPIFLSAGWNWRARRERGSNPPVRARF